LIQVKTAVKIATKLDKGYGFRKDGVPTLETAMKIKDLTEFLQSLAYQRGLDYEAEYRAARIRSGMGWLEFMGALSCNSPDYREV